jgi:hypothetical protein
MLAELPNYNREKGKGQERGTGEKERRETWETGRQKQRENIPKPAFFLFSSGSWHLIEN